MSIPMVTCAICQAQITKRSSLLVEPYGRICRSHSEVEQHKDKLAEIANNKKLAQGMQNISIMMMVENIRALAAVKRVGIELVLLACSRNIPENIRKEVIRQVREKGPMTSKEIGSAVAMAMVVSDLT